MSAERCRSCQAPLRWGLTKSGKSMPLDLESHPDGTVELTDAQDPRELPEARVLAKKSRRSGGPRYVSHFATCIHAERWRT